MSAPPDVTIAGAGIIGLATAAAASQRGLTVLLIGDQRAGEASSAAAGMLAPSIERAVGPAHDFAVAARDRYPAYVEELAEQTGIRVPLNRLGILQVALTEAGVKGLRRTALPNSQWIERRELAELRADTRTCHWSGPQPGRRSCRQRDAHARAAALVDASPLVTRLDGTVIKVIARRTASACRRSCGRIIRV